jgi:uncharacterized protein (TIGR00255 family)
MLLSMTGFGDARWQGPGLTIGVQVRSVNNRFLKVSIRAPEPFQALEPEIERAVRAVLKRGTVFVQVWVQREPKPEDYQINQAAVRSYLTQLAELAEGERRVPLTFDAASLLSAPGVVMESESLRHHDMHEDWARIGPVVREALEKVQKMRAEEGRKMANELADLARALALELSLVQQRAPAAVLEYGKRLHEKLHGILSEQGIVLEPANLVKEVAIFAERTDINEEIVRLGSHVEQFQAIMEESESSGRKLDFLVQEMNREVNTIGSKGSDVALARHVVEMKAALEKMRELIQNVE